MGKKLSAYRLDLPKELIAAEPLKRGEARLMVVHRDTGKIEHKKFKDMVDYIQPLDALVLNDTKVLPGLLKGHKEKTGAQIEVLLLRQLSAQYNLWDAIVSPARKIRVGNKLFFGDGELVAEVLDNTTSRGRTIKFLFDGDNQAFMDLINTIGVMPLPTTIQRKPTEQDKLDYQTVLAAHLGAVVAPMTALHFSKYLLKLLELKEVMIAPITLHTSLSLFNTIDVEDLAKYKMDAENFIVSPMTTAKINRSLEAKKKIFVVGANMMKAVENAANAYGQIKPMDQWTNHFIFPKFQCKITSALITNLHLPQSIPMINTAAFAGYDLMMKAYETAIEEKYRFFVYGDAMLIL